MAFFEFQILREINFGDSTSSKSAILHIEGLGILIFQEFLHILNAGIYKLAKFRAPEMTKTADFALVESPKLISRKI